MDENVNSPEPITNTPAESAPAPSQGSDVNQTNQQPEAKPGAQPSQEQQPGAEQGRDVVTNLNKALSFEREKRRELQRQIAQLQGRPQQGAYNPEELGDVMNHPFVMDLLDRQATTELKEGVSELLKNYPQLPKRIADAIIRNPRGFVQPSTKDVQNALLDIQDYLEEVSVEIESAEPSPQPKAVPIVGNNQVVSAPNQDVNIQKLLDKAPEELTPDEVKVLSDYQQRLSAKRG